MNDAPTICFSTRTILIFMLYALAIYGMVAGGMYDLDRDLAVKAKIAQESSVKW